MNIKQAIERFAVLEKRRCELSSYLKYAHREDSESGNAHFSVACGGVYRHINIPVCIGDTIIPKVEDELSNVCSEIEKIKPVIDAANMQLKGIFS